MKQIILCLILLLFYSFRILAQGEINKIDSLLRSTYPETGPGGVFLISKGNQILYKQAFGEANIELNVPMHTESVFQVGSITKQFTAVAIMMLVEEGKIDLHASIRKYISGIPHCWNAITVHHLLTHTSGLRDFTKVKGLGQISRDELTVRELIGFFKKERPEFKPGEQYQYCNAGYILLGHIIEVVSGEIYEDFIEERIFKIIVMKQSYYWHPEEIIPNRAYGYLCREQCGNKPYIDPSIPYASGSLMSTAGDLHLWNQAINNKVLLNDGNTKLLFKENYLNNGVLFDYGYGWHLIRINNAMTYQHGGDIFGFKSMGIYIPSQDLYIIGLTNCNCNSPTQIVREMSEIMIKREL